MGRASTSRTSGEEDKGYGSRDLPMRSLNESRVFDDTAWQLREGLAEFGDSLGLHLEATLLGHGGIPDIVSCAEGCVDEDIACGAEAIGGRVVRGHVDDRVNIGLQNR